MTGFTQGFSYPFRGFGFLRQHPRLLKYVALPFAINTTIFTLVVYLGLDFFNSWVTESLPQGDAWYWVALYYVVWLLAVVVTAILVFFTFVVVGNIVASPFNDLLCERVELEVTGHRDEGKLTLGSVLKEAGATIVREIRRIWMFVVGMVLLLMLLIVPWVGWSLYSILSFLFTLYFLTVEYTGFVLDRKGFSFKQQRQYIRHRRLMMMGFGLGAFVLLSIPFLQLLAIPMSVIGATLLYLEHPPKEAADGT